MTIEEFKALRVKDSIFLNQDEKSEIYRITEKHKAKREVSYYLCKNAKGEECVLNKNNCMEFSIEPVFDILEENKTYSIGGEEKSADDFFMHAKNQKISDADSLQEIEHILVDEGKLEKAELIHYMVESATKESLVYDIGKIKTEVVELKRAAFSLDGGTSVFLEMKCPCPYKSPFFTCKCDKRAVLSVTIETADIRIDREVSLSYFLSRTEKEAEDLFHTILTKGKERMERREKTEKILRENFLAYTRAEREER